MLLYEWPLVFFTLFAQAAIGIVLVGEIMLKSADDVVTRSCIRSQSIAALFFIGIGAIFSLCHTGYPLNSYNTILNILSSWLSREIAVLGLTGFAIFGTAFYYFKNKNNEHPMERKAALVAVLSGILLIVVIGNLYNLEAVPAWNNYSGLVQFFATACLFGTFWHGLAFSVKAPDAITLAKNPCGCLTSALVVFSVLGLCLVGISIPIGFVQPETILSLNPSTVLISQASLACYKSIRMLLLSIAVILFIISVLLSGMRGGRLKSINMGIIFLLLLVAEFLGRHIFYIAYARIGM